MNKVKTVEDIVALIKETAQTKRPLVVVVDGFGGSGKTTLSTQLVKSLGNTSTLHLDDFIVSPHPQDTIPFDWDAFEHSLEEIKSQATFTSRNYDRPTNKKVEGEQLPVTPIVIVEGIRLQTPRLNGYYDFKIWLDCPLDIAVERGKKRDREEQGVNHDEMWDKQWKPQDQKYFDENHPDQQADVIIKTY